jgi:hypothetical protein
MAFLYVFPVPWFSILFHAIQSAIPHLVAAALWLWVQPWQALVADSIVEPKQQQ